MPRSKRKNNNYKSKWEQTVASQLINYKQRFVYEGLTLPYTIPETVHKYKPDFIIKNKKGETIIIEAKGKFVPLDRKKHLFIKEQYPKIRLYILFQNANQRLNKRSKTTYGQWCEKHGIMYSHKTIKKEWLD